CGACARVTRGRQYRIERHAGAPCNLFQSANLIARPCCPLRRAVIPADGAASTEPRNRSDRLFCHAELAGPYIPPHAVADWRARHRPHPFAVLVTTAIQINSAASIQPKRLRSCGALKSITGPIGTMPVGFTWRWLP